MELFCPYENNRGMPKFIIIGSLRAHCSKSLLLGQSRKVWSRSACTLPSSHHCLLVFHFPKYENQHFFIFGWQSPAELIKSEVRKIPSDFIDHVSCVFYAEDFLSMLFGTWKKNHNLVVHNHNIFPQF